MVEKLERTPNILVVGLTAIIGFGIFLCINLFVFRNLPQSEYGILHYEFAWTTDRVSAIFTAWGLQGMAAQTKGIWWDFAYIVGYSLFIGSCILLVTRMNTGRIHNIGLFLTLTPFVAGFLDIVENIFLLIMLYNSDTLYPMYPKVATISAGLKFTLLLVGIIYFLIALIMGIITKLRGKPTPLGTND